MRSDLSAAAVWMPAMVGEREAEGGRADRETETGRRDSDRKRDRQRDRVGARMGEWVAY